MPLVKILIADDEPAVLEIMARKVASAGFQVITAKDGKEAWEKIQQYVPDIVLLDLVMPHMDGFAVLNALRKNPPSNKWIPAIIISALDEVRNMQKSFELQADHYLIKPCTIEEILRAIKLMIPLIPLRNS
jgi:DNA-binding response OmpR family regulator